MIFLSRALKKLPLSSQLINHSHRTGLFLDNIAVIPANGFRRYCLQILPNFPQILPARSPNIRPVSSGGTDGFAQVW